VRRIAIGLLVTVLTLVVVAQAGAACTRQWSGSAGDGNWSTAANWTPVGAPTLSDDVCIRARGVVILPSGTVAVNTLSTIAGVTLRKITAGTTTLAVVRATDQDGGMNVSRGILRIDAIGARQIVKGPVNVASGAALELAGRAHHLRGMVTAQGTVRLLARDVNLEAGSDIARLDARGADDVGIGGTSVVDTLLAGSIRELLTGDLTITRSLLLDEGGMLRGATIGPDASVRLPGTGDRYMTDITTNASWTLPPSVRGLSYGSFEVGPSATLGVADGVDYGADMIVDGTLR
jgi:hypothetical protein